MSSAPEESYLLGLQLEHEGLDFDIVPVASVEELGAALAAPLSMLVADLPLPWSGADDELSELQRTRPDIPVVFRWGASGSWSVEDATTQLGRSVRGALALGLDRVQTPEERRRLLHEVVRYQTAHLRLNQLDTWDWHEALHRATEIMSETAGVERVSVWKFDADHGMLDCEALFLRSTHAHPDGGELKIDPSYRRAIETATFVAAHDAQNDPRTSAFTADYLRPLGITSMLDAPIRASGRIVGVVCLEHVGPARRWNIVEQCAASAFASVVARILEVRERRRVEEQLQQARRLEVIGRMAGAIAHDFSNLATVISGFSESVLADLPRGDPHRDALVAIHQAGLSATSLVRQLMAYTRLPGTDAAPIDLGDALEKMAHMIEGLLGDEIALQIRTPLRRLCVRIDLAQLHRIVLNLAANARDALAPGGTFRLELDGIDGDDAHPLGLARLRAIDDGVGIPPEILRHVFEPLYTTKADRGGTGLGLAAVRAIVTQAGGTITAESVPGRSTCFTTILPLSVASPATGVADTAPAKAATGAGTVLVVDDDPSVCALIRRVLERCGYSVVAAATPNDALASSLTLDRIGLVISDLTMRDMSGAQLIARLRATHPHLPALLVTGQSDLPNLFADVPAGETRVLAKPFDLKSLTDRVRELTQAAAST